MKKLAVIILNWNGREMLARFLPSVVRSSSDDCVQIVVADNGSTDDSVEWLEKWSMENCTGMKIIKFGRNYGYAEGYNRALNETDCEFAVLLNSDVEVPEGWWKPMLAFMEAHTEAGAAQPKILSCREPDRFEYAGAAGGLLDRLGYPYCRGRVLSAVEKDKGQYDGQAVEVAWASGAALMVRKKAFMEAGGLDPLFFAHMEEIDLCWRMMLKGYRVYVVPSSHVYHLGGGSLNYGNPRKTYLNFRNNLLLLHKNLPQRQGKRKLFWRRLADTMAFLLFAFTGKFADAGAVLKAHGDFRKMRKAYSVFPEENIFPRLPGTDKYIFLSRFRKK